MNLKIKAAQQITVRGIKTTIMAYSIHYKPTFSFILAFFNSLFHLPTHSCIQREVTEHLLGSVTDRSWGLKCSFQAIWETWKEMRVGSSLLRPPFLLLPSSHCLRATHLSLKGLGETNPFFHFLPHWHSQSQVREVARSKLGLFKALFCQQNLRHSYWLPFKDIFWNFSPARLKFDLDIDLSAPTTQQASGHFSGIILLHLAMNSHLLVKNHPSLPTLPPHTRS